MTPSQSKCRNTGGFTLIELMITVSLLALVTLNVYMVIGDSTKAMGAQTVSFDAEAQARRALDRIALAVIGASRQTLFQTQAAPWSASELNYESSLGMQDGVAVWSDPQRIALTAGAESREVMWYEKPNAPDERRSVWSSYVSQFLQGEILNGKDDNGNGLIDEQGLSFTLEGNSVIIRLTVARPDKDGKFITRTFESRVTCRN